MKEGCSVKALAVSLGIFAVVLAAVFTVVWMKEAKEFEEMDKVDCMVDGSGTVRFVCENTRCTGVGKDRHCSTHKFTCWSAYWNVTFTLDKEVISTNVTDEGRYEDRVRAQEDVPSHSVGSQYELWYNKENPLMARWVSPKPGLFLALMVIGWTCLALAVIVGVVFDCREAKPGYDKIWSTIN